MAEENYMNQGPAVSPQEEVKAGTKQTATNRIRFVGTGGNLEAVELRSEPKVRLGLPVRAVKSGTRPEGVRTLKQNTDEYVRKNPTKAVLTALAIGFVFGLMRRG